MKPYLIVILSFFITTLHAGIKKSTIIIAGGGGGGQCNCPPYLPIPLYWKLPQHKPSHYSNYYSSHQDDYSPDLLRYLLAKPHKAYPKIRISSIRKGPKGKEFTVSISSRPSVYNNYEYGDGRHSGYQPYDSSYHAH